jgi:hypothetical protein
MPTFEQQLDQRLELTRTVVQKAQFDAAFRALLKADPVKAVKEALGMDWDPSISLEVVEESEKRCVLVLPALFPEAANDDELSDDDLELVAAGVCMPPSIKKTGSHIAFK